MVILEETLLELEEIKENNKPKCNCAECQKIKPKDKKKGFFRRFKINKEKPVEEAQPGNE